VSGPISASFTRSSQRPLTESTETDGWCRRKGWDVGAAGVVTVWYSWGRGERWNGTLDLGGSAGNGLSVPLATSLRRPSDGMTRSDDALMMGGSL
jgi:hypothetical protein